MRFILYFSLVLVLSPLLILQGLYTRHKAGGLPEPEGKRQGVKGKGPELSVLILGDSAGAGVGVDYQSETLSGQLVKNLSKKHTIRWRLLAYTGDTTQDCIHRLSNIDPSSFIKFDYVLISLGVNDVTSRVVEKVWLNQCERLVQIITNKFQPQKILWSELPPMGEFSAMPQPLRWVIGQRRDMLAKVFNKWIAGQKGLELLSMPEVRRSEDYNIADWIAADGFHPGEKMYELWGKIAAERIMADNQSSI